MKRFDAGASEQPIRAALLAAYRHWLEVDGVDLVALANSLNTAAARAISTPLKGAEPCAI